MVGRPRGSPSADWTGRGSEGVRVQEAEAAAAAGRSSGDDGGRVGVGVQRIAVGLVEKSVGAGRDEADAQQDGRGHGKKERSSSLSEGVGGRWEPHLSRFMQPWLFIGEAALTAREAGGGSGGSRVRWIQAPVLRGSGAGRARGVAVSPFRCPVLNAAVLGRGGGLGWRGQQQAGWFDFATERAASVGA